MNKLFEGKAAVTVSAIWFLVFILSCRTEIESVLCSRGINVIGKEYYRYLTAGLVHTNLIHTLGNIYIILWIGSKYENSIGSLRFYCIGFIGSAICYLLFSLIYENAASSIGGSGFWYVIAGYVFMQQVFIPEFPKSGQMWLILYVSVFLSISAPSVRSMILIPTKSALVFHMVAIVLGVCMGIVSRGIQ